jgi:hypothetical protein
MKRKLNEIQESIGGKGMVMIHVACQTRFFFGWAGLWRIYDHFTI